MALVPKTLAADIESAMSTAFSNTSDDPSEARKTLAIAIANAIDKYIKSAEVHTTVTTVVATTAGAGTGTGIGEGKLT